MLQVGYINKDNNDKYFPVFLLDKSDMIEPDDESQVFCSPFLNDILELIPNKKIEVDACTTDCFREIPEDSVLIADKIYNLSEFSIEEEDPNESDDWQLEGKASIYKKIVDKYEEEL